MEHLKLFVSRINIPKIQAKTPSSVILTQHQPPFRVGISLLLTRIIVPFRLATVT